MKASCCLCSCSNNAVIELEKMRCLIAEIHHMYLLGKLVFSIIFFVLYLQCVMISFEILCFLIQCFSSYKLIVYGNVK